MSAKIYQHILDLIEDELTTVIKRIAAHFDMPLEEVSNIAFGSSVEEPRKTVSKKLPLVSSKKSKEDTPNDIQEKQTKVQEEVAEDEPSLVRYSNVVLVGICKKKGLKVSGKKDELIKRIVEANSSENKPSALKKSSQSLLRPHPVKKSSPSESSVLKKISQVAPRLHISRNSWGNYEHQDSHLVFDRDERVVIGKQLSDGNIADIDDDDIETCKKYKFEYRLPENLDKNKKNIDDVAIEEMEELGEDDFEEEVEEEVVSDEEDE